MAEICCENKSGGRETGVKIHHGSETVKSAKEKERHGTLR